MARRVKPGEAVKVTIVTNTMAPIKSIALAQLNMTGDMRHSLGDVSLGEAEDIFKDLCKTELQGAFEFVHFNIQMEGVTRAFQQQLTRTRLASYSAESLRFTKSGMEVLAGPGIWASNESGVDWAADMQRQMEWIERTYNEMIESGVPVEDARGILPLNVLSKIGMCVSYKTLVAMSRVRMCYQSQAGEWGEVFSAIVSALNDIDPLLTIPLGAFCDHGQKCPFGSRLDRKCERGNR
jgi:thymidylate synthase ThyX